LNPARAGNFELACPAHAGNIVLNDAVCDATGDEQRGAVGLKIKFTGQRHVTTINGSLQPDLLINLYTN